MGNFWRHLRRTFCYALGFFSRNKWVVFILFNWGLLIAWYMIENVDKIWLDKIQEGKNHSTSEFASLVEQWGDFPGMTMITVLCLWILGVYRRSSYLRRLSAVVFLSAAFAGITANILRASTGRPRPHAQDYDAFYGPTTRAKYQSFPSAHCATSWGTAIPLVRAAPVIGVPLTVCAEIVVWSRMYTNSHNPSDTLIGALIGIFFGIACAAHLARVRRRISQRRARKKAASATEERAAPAGAG